MKNLIIALFFFLLTVNLAIAQNSQDYVFRVMVSSGKNEIKKASVWKSLRTGNKLLLSDEIQIETGGFLGLAHKSGKTIELKKPGIYKISEIASKVNATNISAAQKYTNFVIAQMTKDSEKPISDKKTTTGSTERGLSTEIKAFVPYNITCIVFEKKSLISWYPLPGIKEYSIILTNLSEEVVFKKMVKDTFLIIDFSDPVFDKKDPIDDNNFKLLIRSNGTASRKNSGEAYSFQILEPVENEAIQKELKSLKSTDVEESSIQKIILASFYEDKKLYLEAVQKYKEAIALNPQLAEYKLMYKEFLERYGMTKYKNASH